MIGYAGINTPLLVKFPSSKAGLGTVPSIAFNEEILVHEPDNSILPGPAVTDPKLTADMTDPTASFLCPSGATRTYADVDDILTGLYFALALARDAQMVMDAAK